eukprot:3487600-Heterocapsa_arctica.AAC.1
MSPIITSVARIMHKPNPGEPLEGLRPGRPAVNGDLDTLRQVDVHCVQRLAAQSLLQVLVLPIVFDPHEIVRGSRREIAQDRLAVPLRLSRRHDEHVAPEERSAHGDLLGDRKTVGDGERQ